MVVLLSDDAIIAIIIVIVLAILWLIADYFDIIKRLEDIPHSWGSEKESKKRQWKGLIGLLNTMGTRIIKQCPLRITKNAKLTIQSG